MLTYCRLTYHIHAYSSLLDLIIFNSVIYSFYGVSGISYFSIQLYSSLFYYILRYLTRLDSTLIYYITLKGNSLGSLLRLWHCVVAPLVALALNSGSS